MTEEKNPKLQRLINILNSFSNSFTNIKKFTAHLDPILEKDRQEDKINLLKAISDAYKKFDIDINDLEKDKVELTDEQKKAIYKSIEFPEKKSVDIDGHLWKSNFILLISSFEFLFGDIISFYYKFYPTSALDKNIELNLKNIYEYKTIEEFVDEIVSKKIEGLLYKSFEDQLLYLQKELKLNIESNIIEWDLIKEATLRRNLIVHNNSRINNRYLTETNKDYTKDIKRLKENERVPVSKEYFERVYQEFYLAGIILIQAVFRKWLNEFNELADALLMDVSYRCLNKEEYISAEKICLFASNTCSINNDFIFRNNINYCLALKFGNKTKELEEQVEKIDISNLSSILVVAYYALKDDEVNTLKHIKNAKTVDKLTYNDITDWPIFKNLRKLDSFNIKVKKIYRIKE
ncbi:hypothetical protein [Chryseobacterium lacus]|uniref:hypothetical protein n=1 Tax=Chryseobacterium lacus TaxID=2058346 RepID=UPI000F89C8F4|nr:hypothetical protein [Chryseobacterium lacus]RST28760.1 hypothetical protein EIZ46_02220 [Chryseobacterium lacus]